VTAAEIVVRINSVKLKLELSSKEFSDAIKELFDTLGDYTEFLEKENERLKKATAS
jgi:hypothetical protein